MIAKVSGRINGIGHHKMLLQRVAIIWCHTRRKNYTVGPDWGPDCPTQKKWPGLGYGQRKYFWWRLVVGGWVVGFGWRCQCRRFVAFGAMSRSRVRNGVLARCSFLCNAITFSAQNLVLCAWPCDSYSFFGPAGLLAGFCPTSLGPKAGSNFRKNQNGNLGKVKSAETFCTCF